MRKQILLILCLVINASFTGIYGQKVIFLHHSTGNGVYMEGNVVAYIDSVNKADGTFLNVSERAYPDDPWPWANYPYDYWQLWVNGSCDTENPRIECISKLAANHDLVVFKHCFPVSAIKANTGNPDVTSDVKTLENYKEQYRALRSVFDSYPGTKFMVWTLVPLHRLATSPDAAERAWEFVQWVKSDWLKEDGALHPNIIIFDYFSLVAELDEKPVNGVAYCLKYDYEKSHSERDSHPNTAANKYAGPVFANAIVNACLNR